MRRVPFRTLLAGCLAVMVVTAGCSGAVPDRDDQTAATPGSSGDRPTATVSATTTPGETATDAALNASALRNSHADYLRGQGSFTVRGNTTITGGARNVTRWEVGRYDVEAETAHVTREPFYGARETTYLAPNGSAYRRQGAATGDPQYAGPREYLAPNLTAARQFGIGLPLAGFSFRSEGRTSYRETSGRVYRSTDATTFAAAADEFNESEVSRFEVVLVVADAGYVKHYAVEWTVDGGDGERTFRIDRRFEAVGATTVSEPGWLDAAVAAAPTPTPEGPENRTFELTDERGRVTQDVTAPRGTYWRDAGPEHTGSYEFSYDLLFDASVGPIVRLGWPDGATRVTATFHYEAGQVPRTEETLTVAAYDPERQLFVPAGDADGVRAEVSADDDAVTVVVTGDALTRFEGAAFVAMDHEYFVQQIREG